MKEIKIFKEILKVKIDEGLTNEKLANYFGCSVRTISYKKKKYGLSNTSFYNTKNSLNYIELNFFEEIKSDILGKTLYKKDICKKYNITIETLNKFISNYNLIENKILDKKCPYCFNLFPSWKSVRAHTSHCKKSNKNFCISLVYGPINLKNLDFISFRELKNKYPKIEKHLIDYIARKVDFKSGDFSKEKARERALKFFELYNKSPSSRDTYVYSWLYNDKIIKENFNTWNKFLEYCNLPLNNVGYGNNSKALDGTVCRSNLEVYFINNILLNNYQYEYEKPYVNSSRVSDFYLPKYTLYIELAGGLRPEVIKEKIELSKKQKLNLLVLYPRQIYKTDFNLEKEIKHTLNR